MVRFINIIQLLVIIEFMIIMYIIITPLYDDTESVAHDNNTLSIYTNTTCPNPSFFMISKKFD